MIHLKKKFTTFKEDAFNHIQKVKDLKSTTD